MNIRMGNQERKMKTLYNEKEKEMKENINEQIWCYYIIRIPLNEQF